MKEIILMKSKLFNLKPLFWFFCGFGIFGAVVFILGGLNARYPEDYYLIALVYFLFFWFIGFISTWPYSKNELVITNKRVFGTYRFKTRVDLPLDSISSVAVSGLLWSKGIVLSTSSGKITIACLKNCNELHKCVSDLLIERQSKPTTTTTIKQEIPQSNADELKKYKELLDSGTITQEEFDAKKKQLLGL